MAQSLPTGYVLDPDDPRAPSVEQWERMLPDERARVVAMLDTVIAGHEEADRLAEDLAGQLSEERRLREEEQRLREEVQQQLADARAEIDRLRKGTS